MASFAQTFTPRRSRPSSITHAIRTGKLRDNRGGDARPNIIALAAGQSNIASWFGSAFNHAGENQFKAILNANNSNRTNTIINGAASGSYLSKRAFDAANTRAGGTLTAGYYWVDDTTTPFTAGPLLTACFTDIISGGYAYADVNVIVWSQGEADSSEIYLSNITSAQYYSALSWLKDAFFTTLPNLRRMLIRPLGRRSASGSHTYESVRLKQQQLATDFPSQVFYGSETYDLPLSDSTHRTEAGYVTEATRAAYETLGIFGIYSGNRSGARIASAIYNGTTITLTFTHDGGTAITNASGTSYNGTPINITPTTSTGIFTITDAIGTLIPISSVHITGTNQVTITPAIKLISTNNNVRCGYDYMLDLDLASMVYDNANPNPLPLRASSSLIVDGVGMSAIEGMSNLVSFFSPESTYAANGTASDAIVWTNRAGSGGSARKDDTKAAPVYYSNISSVLAGCPAIAGWVFDGTASQKLLVENALTSSSDYTLFVVATPYTGVADASTHNVLIATAMYPSTALPLFAVRQTYNDLKKMTMFTTYSGGNDVDTMHDNTTAIITMKRAGGTAYTWDEGGTDNNFTLSGTPVIDADAGTPVYAIGNIPLKGTGTTDSASAFRGAVHYVVLFDTALTDAQVNQLRLALGNAVNVAVA